MGSEWCACRLPIAYCLDFCQKPGLAYDGRHAYLRRWQGIWTKSHKIGQATSGKNPGNRPLCCLSLLDIGLSYPCLAGARLVPSWCPDTDEGKMLIKFTDKWVQSARPRTGDERT